MNLFKNLNAIRQWIDDISDIDDSRVLRHTVIVVSNVHVTYYDTQNQKLLYNNSTEVHFDTVGECLTIIGITEMNPNCHPTFNPQWQDFKYRNGVLIIKGNAFGKYSPYEVSLS